MKIEDVVIIGAGPAGIAAAIQLKRYGLEPVVFEKDKIGGLLHNANLVENYPGFPGGIPGAKLVQLFKAQFQAFEIQTQQQEITGVDYQDGMFEFTSSKETCYSKFLIIASGTIPNPFDNISIPKEVEDRVFYEVSNLGEISNMEIVIVGAGDAAFDYALNLAQRNNRVTILNRGNEVKSLDLLVKRIEENAGIYYREYYELLMISPNRTGMSLTVISPVGEIAIHADYLIGALGRKPNLGFLNDGLMIQMKELEDLGALYLAGDVKNETYRQTSIAVGDGVMAAMRIHRMIKETIE